MRMVVRVVMVVGMRVRLIAFHRQPAIEIDAGHSVQGDQPIELARIIETALGGAR